MEFSSGSYVRLAVFQSYITGRLLRRGLRLKSEGRDRILARAGPTANSIPHNPRRHRKKTLTNYRKSVKE